MTGREMYIREFLGWLVTSLFLPLLAPFIITLVCMFLAAFVGEVDTSILKNMWNTLLDKGVFAFLSITILLSLLQDYKAANKVIILPLAIAWTLLLLLLGLLFINSLGLIEGVTTFSEFDKRYWFIILSIFSVVFAAILKLEILYYKFVKIYKL